MDQRITRRRFIGWSLAGAAATFSGLSLGCADPAAVAKMADQSARLKARPGKPSKSVKKRLHSLGLTQGKDGVLSVPRGYKPDNPVPLIVLLHGAGGRSGYYDKFFDLAIGDGIAVMAPDSRGPTWDVILGGFGPDVAFLDRALAHTFERVAVDPRRIALAGFSDGASYALSVGLANGDLFSHVLAFSPGFMKVPERVGKPPAYVTHGDRDEVLPVTNSRDRIVPQLKQWGHEVIYKEFDGGHTASPEMIRDAFRWFAGA
jgi:phospholipase/carboxylesterase